VLTLAGVATLGLASLGVITMVSEGDAADQLSASDPVSPREATPRADRADRPSPTAIPSSAAPAEGGGSPSTAPTTPAAPRTTPAAPRTKAPAPARTAASPSASPRRAPSPSPSAPVETCQASYYDQGDTTANGEPFNPNGLTAAHRTLPFNTKVTVTNLANGKSVTVRINDRGPFVEGRCIDLTLGAFERIASVDSGVIEARVEIQ
jgi:rare lipoprotein A